MLTVWLDRACTAMLQLCRPHADCGMDCRCWCAPCIRAENDASIFSPVSTPSQSIFSLSMFVLAITCGIFVVVGGLIFMRYVSGGRVDDSGEPPQSSAAIRSSSGQSFQS
jgi:cytochrome c oxidase subunit 2